MKKLYPFNSGHPDNPSAQDIVDGLLRAQQNKIQGGTVFYIQDKDGNPVPIRLNIHEAKCGPEARGWFKLKGIIVSFVPGPPEGWNETEWEATYDADLKYGLLETNL